MSTQYFTSKIVEDIHVAVINLWDTPNEDIWYGWWKSEEDAKSILDFITMDYYPRFIDKITHLVFSFNKNHIFANGNKRTSIAVWAFFLKINWYEYCVDKFIRDMENISVSVADNLIWKSLLEEIIDSIINEEDYNEVLKLEIINAIAYKNQADENFYSN